MAFASWIGSPEPCEEVSVVDCMCVLFSLYICVYLHVFVRAKGGRGVEAGGERLMRNQCLSASSARAQRPR